MALSFRQPQDTTADRAALLAAAKGEVAQATSLGEAVSGFFPLLDDAGEELGWITSSYPASAAIHGYAGPSEFWVLLDRRRSVRAVGLLGSADTAGHVAKVREDAAFWQQWIGKTEAQLGAADPPRIVSGATLTSEAIAPGVAARFGAKGMEQWFGEPMKLADVLRGFPRPIVSRSLVSRA